MPSIDIDLSKPEPAPAEQKPAEGAPKAPEVPERFRAADGSLDPAKILTSYQELERKLTEVTSKAGEKPAGEPAAAKPDAEGKGDEWSADEFFGEFLTEIAERRTKGEQGMLSPESYAKIKETTGFDQQWVDGWVRGQEAIATQMATEVMDAAVGGKARYEKMMQWAESNLTEAAKVHYQSQIEAALANGDTQAATFVAQGLAAQWKAAIGESFTPIQGVPNLQGVKAFQSREEAHRYIAEKTAAGVWGKDPAVEREFERRLIAGKRQGLIQ